MHFTCKKSGPPPPAKADCVSASGKTRPFAPTVRADFSPPPKRKWARNLHIFPSPEKKEKVDSRACTLDPNMFHGEILNLSFMMFHVLFLLWELVTQDVFRPLAVLQLMVFLEAIWMDPWSDWLQRGFWGPANTLLQFFRSGFYIALILLYGLMMRAKACSCTRRVSYPLGLKAWMNFTMNLSGILLAFSQ